MKGLLLKDLYMMKRYMRSYLLMMVVFMTIAAMDPNNMFFVYYPCILSGMVPTSLLGYDERSKWDQFAGTLPCTRAQIVSVKYLLGVILQLLVLVLTAVAQGIAMLRSGSADLAGYLILLEMLVMLGCISSSVTLPFMFKFGVEKGRMAYYVMIGLVCAGSGVAGSLFNSGIQYIPGSGIVMPLLTLAAVGVYALSWRLSIRFYEKRELK